MSSAKLIPCPKCRHQNRLKPRGLVGSITCAECGHSFASDSDAVRTQSKAGQHGSLDIIPVRCCHCDKKFGVKARSAGKEVACPHCKTRQSATADERKSGLNENIAAADRPIATIQDVKTTHTGTRHIGPDSTSADVIELLPPKYLVPSSMELATECLVRFRQSEDRQLPKKTGIEIDTNVLRLPTGDGVTHVKPLAREIRDRRKRLRVAVVYLLGVIVLIVVFWWLMGRIDPETP